MCRMRSDQKKSFGKTWNFNPRKICGLETQNSKMNLDLLVWRLRAMGCPKAGCNLSPPIRCFQIHKTRFLIDPCSTSFPPVLSGSGGCSGDAALGWRPVWPHEGHFRPSCLRWTIDCTQSENLNITCGRILIFLNISPELQTQQDSWDVQSSDRPNLTCYTLSPRSKANGKGLDSPERPQAISWICSLPVASCFLHSN